MPNSQETDSPQAHAHFANLPWGCRMLVDPVTQWPLRAEIIHDSEQHHGEGCECCSRCRATGCTDKELVVQYMHQRAYFNYYQRDPETFNAWTVNELLKVEAGRFGLEPGNIWDRFPDCIPRAKDLDLRTCPADIPFRDATQMDDGTVMVFEGRTLGPDGRTLAELLAEGGTYEEGTCMILLEDGYAEFE